MTAVAFGADAAGQLLLAAGGDSGPDIDGMVRLWDPTTGAPIGDPITPIGEPFTGRTGPVTVVAFGADADGHPLLATVFRDHMVQLWDATTGAPIGDPLTGHTGPVEAVAFGVDADGHPLLGLLH